jgi:hypothetical protein
VIGRRSGLRIRLAWSGHGCDCPSEPPARGRLSGLAMLHPSSTILVITGMHRSGTSAVTAAFASAGLDVGRRLMPAARGNPRGHFEDLDFVSLHERILRSNGLGSEGFTTAAEITVPVGLADEADALVHRRRSESLLWGWKDPRTTLLLEWWARRLPEARFVLLFRSPAETIDSLFRRGDDVFALNPALSLDVWLAYNSRIRNFALAHPGRCQLADSRLAVADPGSLVTLVRDRWQLPLDCPAELAEPALFRSRVSQQRRQVVAGLAPAALETYAALTTLSGGSLSAEGEPPGDHQFIALAEWARAAGLEGGLSRAESLLSERERERDAAFAELAAVSRERDEALARLTARAQRRVHERIGREINRVIRKVRLGRADQASPPATDHSPQSMVQHLTEAAEPPRRAA